MVEFTGKLLSAEPLAIETPKSLEASLERLVGKYVTVKVSKPHRPRTTGEKSQNHHLNGHIQMIAMETGNDFETVKEVVKQRAISMGYPFRTYKGLVVPYSESEASVEECAILIEAAHMLAAEEGIILKEEE